MDYLRLRCIACRNPCRPVTETCPHSHYQVGFLRHPVRGEMSVHTGIPHIQRMIRRHTGKAEKSGRYRRPGLFRQFAEGISRPRYYDSVSRKYQRSLGIIYHRCHRSSKVTGWASRWFRKRSGHIFKELLPVVHKIGHLHLGVLGETYHHRTRLAGGCDMKSLRHHGRNLLRLRYLIAPFGDRKRNIYHIGLLEEIGTEILCPHLGGNADKRSGIQHRIRNACDEIRGPRPGCSHTDTRSAACPGIPLRSVHCPLLVADEYMPYPVRIVIQLIVQRHNRSSRIAEYGIDTFLKQ